MSWLTVCLSFCLAVDDAAEETTGSVLSDIKRFQKYRKQKGGLDVDVLSRGTIGFKEREEGKAEEEEDAAPADVAAYGLNVSTLYIGYIHISMCVERCLLVVFAMYGYGDYTSDNSVCLIELWFCVWC